MNKPKSKLFGENWVGWLNILILQWFFVRLYYTECKKTKWGLLKKVVPLTGWWNEFVYI